VITECNITGNWKHYSKTMVDACCHGDITVALYPFKNIYCYVCNTDGPVRNSFFLNVVSRFLFQYYVFNISEGYDSYTVNNDTQSSQYNQPHDNEYHKWDMKMNKLEWFSSLIVYTVQLTLIANRSNVDKGSVSSILIGRSEPQFIFITRC
jgi:hypothetical protein